MYVVVGHTKNMRNERKDHCSRSKKKNAGKLGPEEVREELNNSGLCTPSAGIFS